MLAHQGLALDCMPNSLEAFAAAIEAGADYIETDAHGTRDGIAVLFHDEELNGVKISSLLKKKKRTHWTSMVVMLALASNIQILQVVLAIGPITTNR